MTRLCDVPCPLAYIALEPSMLPEGRFTFFGLRLLQIWVTALCCR